MRLAKKTLRNTMPTAVATSPDRRNRTSLRRRRRRLASTAVRVSRPFILFVLLTVLANNVQADDVQGERGNKQCEPKRERSERLGAVELVVADKQRYYLYRYRRYGFKRVYREVCNETGRHHHDHGLADGAGYREQHSPDNARQRRGQNHVQHRL